MIDGNSEVSVFKLVCGGEGRFEIRGEQKTPDAAAASASSGLGGVISYLEIPTNHREVFNHGLMFTLLSPGRRKTENHSEFKIHFYLRNCVIGWCGRC